MVSQLISYVDFIRHDSRGIEILLKIFDWEVSGRPSDCFELCCSFETALSTASVTEEVSVCILRRILKVANSMRQLVPAVSIPSASKRVSES